MDTQDLAIHGATVVRPSGRAVVSVYVDDGRITAVTGERLPADEVVDGGGLLLLPGAVDTHVHLMDPGPTEREDFPHGTAAAAVRGVTSIVEHTHAHPVRTPDDLEAKRAHLRGRSAVDFGLAAHVWPDTIDGIGELWRAGAAFFKLFTCTTHGVPGIDPAGTLAAFDRVAAAGARILVHGEDESLTEQAERLLKARGREDNGVLPEWRNREAELVAVAATGILAAHTGAAATIAHVSSPDVAAVVEEWRRRGADLAAEACPQYFLLREEEVLEHGALRKFTPPARARTDDDEAEMWRLLRAGVLTHVATDHAPSTLEQKAEGGIWDAHFGLPGLDTTLPLLVDAALRGRLSLEELTWVYAEAPARRYGLYPRKGVVREGSDADLVLVDPGASGVVRDDDVRSKAGWSPYAGRETRGEVVATWLRGRRIAADGELLEPGGGEFLPGAGTR